MALRRGDRLRREARAFRCPYLHWRLVSLPGFLSVAAALGAATAAAIEIAASVAGWIHTGSFIFLVYIGLSFLIEAIAWTILLSTVHGWPMPAPYGETLRWAARAVRYALASQSVLLVEAFGTARGAFEQTRRRVGAARGGARRLGRGRMLEPNTGPDRRPVDWPSAALPELASLTTAELGEHWATWGAARDGARIVLTRAQAYALVLLAALAALMLLALPRLGLIVCLEIITVLYFVTGLHKVTLLVRGESAAASSAPESEVATGEDLPVYTVLVPLHREGRILPALVERLKRIDYPPERLQVLLLIESDDEETHTAVHQYPLPPHIRPMLMPPGQPRTKPRALNIGLHEAQGEYIVIYDAEDQPDADQLRKAAAALRTLPAHVVCVQARLIFYNRQQSLLTHLFAVDYAVWYDQLLPGLTTGLKHPRAFVPLGGTSNHFRVHTLRQIGGWDPFNVTEDCDLGVRLGREGLSVAMLDSTTWEEAVPHIRPWVRQRSRWVKGYIQTYLVHMRHPLLLCRELRLRGFLDFQLLVGVSSFLLLINPLMWGLTATYVATKGTGIGNFIQTLYPPIGYYPALVSMVVWNFIFFYCNTYVCVRHNFIDLTRYTLLTPLYWVLMSTGAWQGLISLIRNPFYWAKTEHGVSLPDTEPSTAVAMEHTRAGP
jgi:glycosyltransferase XagB